MASRGSRFSFRHGSIVLTSIITILLSAASPTRGQSRIRRYLYVGTPDGAQAYMQAPDHRSAPGILIFDIDNGHELVRRIDMPRFAEGLRGYYGGLRGFTGNLLTHSVYFSIAEGGLGAFDLETEEIVWEQSYHDGGCCDRSSITMDGKKIYAPTGWWYPGADSGLVVVDAKNGELIKRIPVGPEAHNSIVSLDGRRVYLGTIMMLTVIDASTDRIIRQIKDVGEDRVFPFTMDRQNRIGYVCLGEHVGFHVVDLETGKIMHRVLAGDEPIPHQSHGVALTPDETELWISDQTNRKFYVFDATKMPPEPKGEVEVSEDGHGWLTFSIDGQYAWTHTSDVFDAKTKKRVATLKDEAGKPIASSKFLEVHFRDGKVVAVGNEFGLGRKRN